MIAEFTTWYKFLFYQKFIALFWVGFCFQLYKIVSTIGTKADVLDLEAGACWKVLEISMQIY